jgi:hypothetical protein
VEVTVGERVNQTRLAEILGITRPAIHKHLKVGLYAAGADGLIDVDAARAAYATRQDRGTYTPGPKPKPVAKAKPVAAAEPVTPEPIEVESGSLFGETPLTRARADKEMAAAERQRIALDKERGRLVDIDEVLAAGREVMGTVCERLEALPSRLAPRAANKSMLEVERLLRDALNEVRTELAKLGTK